MCQLFIGADPALWESRSHSLRLSGVATSIRLEEFFWEALDEIAARDGMRLPQLIVKLRDEAEEAGHDMANFASFLRVCAGRYMALKAAGAVPGDLSVPLASLPAAAILAGERARRRAVPAG